MTPYQIFKLLKAHAYTIIGIGMNRRKTKVLLFRHEKLAYIPISKTANTSIKTALLPLTRGVLPPGAKVHQYEGFERCNLQDCVKVLGSDWFIFAVVRDPVDRAISAWQDKFIVKRKLPPNMSRHGLQLDDSFSTFIRKITLWPPHTLDGHIIPQSLVLGVAPKLPIHIYRFEELASGWEEIRAEIEKRGGARLDALPHLNSSRRDDVMMDVDTKKRLAKLYADDFREFGYRMTI